LRLDEIWSDGRPVLMIDAGDMFGQRTRVEREQTRFLCEVHSEFGYDAIGLGERDLNYGVEYLREMIDQYGLPFTNANVRDSSGELVLPEYLMIERAGLKIGICSVLDPQQRIITMSAKDEEFTVADPVGALREVLPRMRKAGAQSVIVIAHVGDQKAEQLLRDVTGIDICLVGHSRRPFRSERMVDRTALISSSFEGRYLGRMDVDFDSEGSMKAFDVTILELGEEIADDSVMLDRVNKFKDHLEEFRLVARGPYQPVKGSEKESFLTERECRKCHMDAWEALRETPHQSAFTTLARKGQAQSPECLVCHTTGYLYKNGYDDRPPQNRLTNVQCEACHGYGSEHSRDGDWLAQARESCVVCHDQENSPEFDYEAYWAKIAH
jgi:cytochrome c554/c'-like protein